jgi:RHS repeat-associated protein
VQDNGTSTTTRVYYAFAGMTVAVRTIIDSNSTLVYFLTDHLGSIVAVTDDTGSLLSEQRYLPFGQVRTDVGSITQTDIGYTGQRNLDAQGTTFDLGLMDYKARFYDPRIMQFQQPDTVIPNLYNPQSLNRYSYVSNSPINLVDPSGHYGICPGTITPTDDGLCGGGIDYGVAPVKPTLPSDPTSGNNNENDGDGQNGSDVVYILICGNDMDDNCYPKDNLTLYTYLLRRPLDPYRRIASDSGASYYDYATGGCANAKDYISCLQGLLVLIVDQMKTVYNENPSTQFVIVGFSGGAPFATGVANGAMSPDVGINATNLSVVELDSRFNDSYNNEENFSALVSSGVNFISINSWAYGNHGLFGHGDYTLLPGSYSSSVPFHQWLAINENIANFVRSHLP